MSATEIFNILSVEDNQADVFLLKEVLSMNQVPLQIDVVGNGEQAMSYLLKQAPFDKVPTPDLVLLDLNLPRKDGREVLAEVKQHPELRRIPVVILTTSNAKKDVENCYELYANSYIIKPENLDEYNLFASNIVNFWFRWASRPRLSSGARGGL